MEVASWKDPLFLEIMDHALNLKTPTFSMKLPTSIGSIFLPACRARGSRAKLSAIYFPYHGVSPLASCADCKSPLAERGPPAGDCPSNWPLPPDPPLVGGPLGCTDCIFMTMDCVLCAISGWKMHDWTEQNRTNGCKKCQCCLCITEKA